jgi:hypothetical protein
MPRRTAATLTLALVLYTITSSAAFASTGTIVSPYQYAWDDDGGYVNWNATGGDVTVTDTGLTGYIWSAGFGWINLDPTEGDVTNSGGTLGGWAWGTNTGWINFSGVTIDSNGVFHGHTVAQSTFGTMTFDCTYCEVTSTWDAPYIAPAPSTASGGNGPPPSGRFSFGYHASGATTSPASSAAVTAATVPASLIPTSPPPVVEPTTKPSVQPVYHKPTRQTAQPQATTVATAPEPTAAVAPAASPSIAYPSVPQPSASPEAKPITATLPPACSWLTCWVNELWQFFNSIF